MSLIRQKVKFDKKLLDQDALRIIKKLTQSGYESYLVGGCIRDLLLGYKPKAVSYTHLTLPTTPYV